MERMIRIPQCSKCPFVDHKGAFGRVAYVPICKAAAKELPYTVGRGHGYMVVATATHTIPDWCPLEKE